MKSAILSFCLLCLFMSPACGQRGGNLFSIDEPAKGPKAKPKAVVTDGKALENWWRDLNGDTEPGFKIFEMKPRKALKAFEIDIGEAFRPHWINCEDWLKDEGKGAMAFIAKVGSRDSKSPLVFMFVVRDGEVIYQSSRFRETR